MSKSLIVGAGDNSAHTHDPAPAGTHLARCVEMIHIGTVPTEWQGQQKMRNLIRMSWELPMKTKVWKEGEAPKPYLVNQKFTLHLGETSKLRPFLESWRGKKFTEKELEGFDVFKVLGAPCTLTVTHKLSSNGKTYAEVTGIGPVMEGMTCPPAANELFAFTVTDFTVEDFNKLPEFLQKEVKTSSEWAKQAGGQSVTSTYHTGATPPQPPANDIPPHPQYQAPPSAPLDGWEQTEVSEDLPF
jgi:hypothetical protein